MKKQLSIKKVTLRDLDQSQLTSMAGGMLLPPTGARETCSNCPTILHCAVAPNIGGD
jgi:hypothetical protein